MLNRRSFFKKCGLLGLVGVLAPKGVVEPSSLPLRANSHCVVGDFVYVDALGNICPATSMDGVVGIYEGFNRIQVIGGSLEGKDKLAAPK